MTLSILQPTYLAGILHELLQLLDLRYLIFFPNAESQQIGGCHEIGQFAFQAPDVIFLLTWLNLGQPKSRSLARSLGYLGALFSQDGQQIFYFIHGIALSEQPIRISCRRRSG